MLALPLPLQALILITATWLVGRFVALPWSWPIIAALMVAFAAAVGVKIRKRASAILIDSRKKMSLSQLQMVVWTVLIVSAYTAIVLARVAAGDKDPVNVGLPRLLWGLMGISTVSLVGSPLIKETKRGKKPAEEAVNRVKSRVARNAIGPIAARVAEGVVEAVEELEVAINDLKTAGAPDAAQVAAKAKEAANKALAASGRAKSRAVRELDDAIRSVETALKALPLGAATRAVAEKALGAATRAKVLVLEEDVAVETETAKVEEGTLCVNDDYRNATFGDVFMGEEIGNCDTPDLGKVQMFYFTLIALVTYAAALFSLMSSNAKAPGEITQFPALSEGLVVLLGISHAGYLGSKVVDHTKTT